MCLEFRQQCFVADATLRQINGLSTKQVENGEIPYPPAVPETSSMPHQEDENNVVMVVDPMALDYDSDFETDNDHHSDTETPDIFRNVFMCKFCDQAFTEQSECSYHETNSHNNAIPYSCNDCDMKFADRLQYSAHLKSVHQNDKPYNCPECERTFARRSDLRKHTVVHTGIKPFTCNVCFKSFSRNTNLSKHMRIHSGQKPFVCPKCPKTFISKGDLTRHAIIHSGHKPFACSYCHLSFGRRDKLIRHERKHFPEQNTKDKSRELQMMRETLAEYGYGKESNENNNDEQTNGETKQECWSSSENMVISLDPFNHSQNNYSHPENNYNHVENNSQCDTSDDLPRVPEHIADDVNQQQQTDERDLPHIPEHITGDSFSLHSEQDSKEKIDKIKRYPCLQCHKRFSNAEGLRIHSTTHNGERPHRCNICGKSFLRKRELDRHVVTHTGMKPFKCPRCDKRFGRKDKLVRHMRIHDVSRDHICMVCGAEFNRKDGLSHHMKTHKVAENDVAASDAIVNN